MNSAELPTHLPSRGDVLLRYEIAPTDRQEVRGLVESTGFFSAPEVAVAVELVDERLARGAASGYDFILAEAGEQLLAYACYGPIPATAVSFDLYWIAVQRACQGQGLGREILAVAEECILRSGGRRVYIETSGRELYRPTRAFYDRNGYLLQATLPDFYAPQDDKLIYVKVLGT